MNPRKLFSTAALLGALSLSIAALTMTPNAANAGPGHAHHAKAVVGALAPDFELTDTDGVKHLLSDYTKEGKTVVLEWFNPDCPFVKKHHVHNTTMYDTEKAFHEQDVVWLAINSGAKGKQGNGLARNKKAIAEYNIDYPVLLDESGKVGMLYGAKTTPHMFIINADGILEYDGAIDNNRNASTPGDINYVEQALSEILAGAKVSDPQTRSYGCGVKYSR